MNLAKKLGFELRLPGIIRLKTSIDNVNLGTLRRLLLLVLPVLLTSQSAHSQGNVVSNFDLYTLLEEKEVHKERIKEFVIDLAIADSLTYARVFERAHSQLLSKPNKRVEILLLTLENFFSVNCQNLNRQEDFDFEKINRALKLALTEENPSLLAWLYNYYALMLDMAKQPHNAVYLQKKSISLLNPSDQSTQFLYDHAHMELCKLLYQLFEYRHCIDYGRKCIELSLSPTSIFKGLNRIYVLDLTGAAYKRIHRPDSSVYFYRELLRQVKTEGLGNRYYNDLWEAIAEGNIGENLMNENRIEEARSYIERYYEFNRRHQDYYNIYLSRNLKARLDFALGKKHEAHAMWRSVLDDRNAHSKPDLILNAYAGMVQYFTKLGKTDSVLVYQNKWSQVEKEVERTIHESGLKAAESKVELENLEQSLQYSQTLISKIKLSRNLSILALILVAVIVVLLVNNRGIRLRHRLQEESLQRQNAEQAYSDARLNLDSIKRSLIEKNQLLDNLNSRIELVEKGEDLQLLKGDLANYVLARDEDWEVFKASFEKVYPHFLPVLKGQIVSLGASDTRIAILIRLGLNNNQMAATLGISPASVIKSKYRLSQKFGLDSSKSLEKIIGDI